jgi:hypothetical protein
MPLSLSLYRCRDKLFLATDKKMVNEHINRGFRRKAIVDKMPDGSVVLHNNKPYDINELTRIANKKAKTIKMDLDKPFSIVIDDRFIK